MLGKLKLFVNPAYRGFGYAFAAVIFLFPVFIIMNVALKDTPVETANTIFFVSATLATLVVSTIRKKNSVVMKAAKTYFRPLLIIGFLNFAASILFFSAVRVTDPSTASFIARFGVVFTILLGVIVLKEKLNRAEILGIILTTAGAFIITYSGVSVELGSLMMLASSAIVSVQQAMLKKYVSKIRPFDLNQLRLIFTSAIIALYALFTSRLVLPPFSTTVLIAASGITSAVIGFYFFIKAMEYMDISKVITIRSIEPFFVTLAAVIFLGSIITQRQILGGMFIVCGMIILGMAHRKQVSDKKIPIGGEAPG